MKPVLVTGGTGTLGRKVVDRLLDADRDVRVVSRHPRATASGPAAYAVDLRDGEGLDAAVDGVDAIVHCASTLRRGDVEAARNVIAAARNAGVSHLVYISIVGVDRVPLNYYRAKYEVERLIESSGLGYTILRATQFHDLVLTLFATQARLPVILAPAGVSIQPVDAAEVAERLVELAVSAPAGRAPDMGGPEIRGASELARSYLRATGRARPILPVRLPGAVFRSYRQGGHLAPARAVGRVTFERFLADRVASGG